MTFYHVYNISTISCAVKIDMLRWDYNARLILCRSVVALHQGMLGKGVDPYGTGGTCPPNMGDMSPQYL